MSQKRIRVDWFRVLVELEQKGHHPQIVSAAIGVPRTTILGWRNYFAEPGHADGERLVQLWCQVIGQPREAMPLNVEDLLSAAKASASKKLSGNRQHT